ncbi:hypothetical protein [Vreelandella massiliensis]|uniref:hypothetical protein n=1 Tax=Vreelandella massiliensis TaxID=1816686 RepID=UPI00096A4610|nr:hypothetical protein [Halomonas massiliensis]
MSKGGDKPDKPEMSKAEKAQHAVSAAEWDHYKETYAPLEDEYLKDSQKEFGDRGRAQASSKVMREGTEATRLAALGGGVSTSADAIGTALTGSKVGATHKAQLERDSRMSGALGIGREIATDTNRSLSGLARSGSQDAISKMQNDLKVDSARSAARSQALGAIAGAGASMYAGGGSGGRTPTADNSLYTNAGLQRSSTQMQSQWAPAPKYRR